MEQLGQATYLFKLRHNIALEGDVRLAQIELEAFLPDGARVVPRIHEFTEDFALLGTIQGLGAPTSYVRSNGVQAMAARGPVECLPELVRRLSFVQRIYCLAADAPAVREWVERLEEALGPILAVHRGEGKVLVEAVPHYTLCELAGVVMRRSQSAQELAQTLPKMVDGLLDRDWTRASVRVADQALSAHYTTAHLGHDLHYYKAKFFPRLARCLLNVCALRSGISVPRVLDPFVGSGTTLLEGAMLNMPSVGLDIDPLSVLISRAKLEIATMDSSWLETEACQVIDRLRVVTGDSGGACFSFPTWLTKNRKMTAERARILASEIWQVRTALEDANLEVRPLFDVLLSDAVSRRIRMRFLGTGVGRFSLTFGKKTIPAIMEQSLRRCGLLAATFEWLRQALGIGLGWSEATVGDARCLPENLGKFDVVVTSPPYLPASSGRESYAKARAPSLIALGVQDPDGVDGLVDRSIGSMQRDAAVGGTLPRGPRELVAWLRQDSLRSIKAGPTARYFLEMGEALREMFGVLRDGGLAVVVSGKQSTFYSSRTREVLYVAQSAEWLADLAAKVGFQVETLLDIQLQKANPNARPRSLDDYYETLIMLRKPG